MGPAATTTLAGLPASAHIAAMFDWNDLRHLLAVARYGSTLAAARALGLNQTTVARRIAALEAALGVQLFERRPDGYRPTARARALIPMAEAMEREAEAVASRVGAARRTVGGVVRVTTTETVAAILLAPMIPALRAEHPGLNLELVVDDRRLDLVRGDADIALRVGSEPSSPSLVRRRMPDSVWAVHCSRDYAQRNGMPGSIGELKAHQIVCGEGPIARIAALAWLERTAADAEIACRSNSVTNLIAAVRAGIGVSVLPCLVGGQDGGLLRCLPPLIELDGQMWLIYHESLRVEPRVRVVADAIAARVEAMRGLLAGQAS